MPIKDWKKIADRPNGLFYEKNNGKRIIIVKSAYKGYFITSKGEIIKKTKTKSQALKFAKEYMRKN